MPRIFIEFERIKNPYCGLGQYSIALGQSLMNAVESNHFQFTYFVPKNQHHFFSSSIQFETPNAFKKNTINPAGLLLPNDIDLWHITHQDSDYFPFKKKGIKLMTIHDLNFLFADDHSKIKRRLNRLSKKINACHHISTISEFSKNEIMRTFGVPHNKITVIYNGIDFYSGTTQPVPSLLNKDFLFTIGQVVEKKNFHTLVEMMRYLPDKQLIIAGQNETSYAKTIDSLIKKFQIGDRVFMSGPVADSEKNWLYQNCQAFVFPSLAEGFGLPPIEAMHAGKPVVLSRATSLPEIAGEHGYFWESFEAKHMAEMVEIAIDNFHQQDRQQAVIQHARRYNWTSAAKEYCSLYQKLLSNISNETLKAVVDLDYSVNRNSKVNFDS